MKVVGFHNQCPIVEFQYRYSCCHAAFNAPVELNTNTPFIYSLSVLSDEDRC